MKKFLFVSIALATSLLVTAQTTQDSLNVYNQTLKVMAYYRSKSYIQTSNGYSAGSALEKLQRSYEKFCLRTDSTITSDGIIKMPVSQYRKVVDANKFYQRETDDLIIDLEAPMMLYDRRIVPRAYYQFVNKDTFDALLDDIVTIFGYDTLSIKPTGLRTKEEQEELYNRYHDTDSIAKLTKFSVIYPTTQFITVERKHTKSIKTIHSKTIIPYLVCILYTKEGRKILVKHLEPDTHWELD